MFHTLQSPGEKVSQLCSKHTDGDMDNIVVNLDIEEFHVDIRQKDKTEGEGTEDVLDKYLMIILR